MNNGLPGLVAECKELLKLYHLPDILDQNFNVSKTLWKKTVMKAVENKSQNILRKEFMTFTKLKNLEMNATDKLKAEDDVCSVK